MFSRLQPVAQYVTMATCVCTGLQLAAQTKPTAAPAQVVRWTAASNSTYTKGSEHKSQFTSHANVTVAIDSEVDKFALTIIIANPSNGTDLLQVEPENIHLFTLAGKKETELHRMTDKQITHAIEDTEIAEVPPEFGRNGLGAGDVGGSMIHRSVKQDEQDQQSAMVRQAYSNADAQAANLIAGELKPASLPSGKSAMGFIFFPKQKPGATLSVQIDIGNTRYEFPFHVPKN